MADVLLNAKIGADVSGLQKGLDQAEKGIKNLETTVKRSTPAVNQAGTSLVNLGRIASDLPFGFIAIQNNLDPLIQSFGTLSRSSGGVGGALKALGGALVGPAGIALAFSVVSSAVTVAIQKYGSLGNAINVLLGRNTSLIESISAADKSYAKFNETVKSSADIAREAEQGASGQIARVKALVEVIESSNETYERRGAAIEALKKINKDWFGALDLEKLKVGDLEVAYKGYIAQIIAAAKAKGFEDELARTNVELDKQKRLLGQLEEAQKKATAARIAAQKQPAVNLGAGTFGAPVAPSGATAGLAEERDAQKRVDEQRKRVDLLQTSVNNLEKSIGDTTKASLDLSIAQDRLGPSTDETAAAAKRAAAENARLTREQEKAEKAAEKLRLEQQRLQEAFKRLAAPRESDLDITEDFRRENPQPEPPPRQFPFNPIDLITAQINAENAKKKQDEYNQSILNTVSTFQDLLGPAINTIFGALENGQSIFKALGQALKALIVQLVATVAKAAILAVILSAISGGGFAIGAAGSAAGATGNFGGIFKRVLAGGGSLTGLRRPTAPTFSGGNISPSGLQLAGQVVFVQRGPDLVGVLNQGNARIGRVG